MMTSLPKLNNYGTNVNKFFVRYRLVLYAAVYLYAVYLYELCVYVCAITNVIKLFPQPCSFVDHGLNQCRGDGK